MYTTHIYKFYQKKVLSYCKLIIVVLALDFMFLSGPENESYIDLPGHIRGRNRVGLEGDCVVIINNGNKFAGRLHNIRYDKVIHPGGIIGDPKVGIEVLISPVLTIASTADRAAEYAMSRLISTVFRPL